MLKIQFYFYNLKCDLDKANNMLLKLLKKID